MRKKQFKAESKRLMDMMINSIYTNKEIFLREIISNASDAIDKLAFLSLTDDKVGIDRSDFAITLTIDKENRTLTVSDNGIGMNADELENNLGIIASSGSRRFCQENEEADLSDTEIIGQFGVGFYSAFMVSDKITVITKKYGEDQAYKWESEGIDGYTVEPCERETVGTDIIMHIKEDGDVADEYSQYVREYPLYKLVKKYSDYIRFPIKLLMPHPVLKEGSTEENPEYEEVFEYDILNSMVPIWHKKKTDVTQEEYDQYYQEHWMDQNPPLCTIPISTEGTVSYEALIYIPKQPQSQYYTDDFKKGLQLYSSGVMIMDTCEDLVPEPFNFIKGVVESPDLSLNISREMLQQSRQLTAIKGHVEKKVKAELKKLLENNCEGYEEFFKYFGRHLKVNLLDSYGQNKELISDLLLFYSSTEKKLVTLEEYVNRMTTDQKYIYYATGESVTSVDNLPQTEIVKDHDMELLYLVDPGDEFIPGVLGKFMEKEFRSIDDADLGFEDEKTEIDESAFKDAFDFIKETLGDKVDEVKATNRLRSHPVCISSGDGITFEMEKYFSAIQPGGIGAKAKRILEINTEHAAFQALNTARETDPEKAKKFATVLYNQALLIAGLPIENPTEYTDLLVSLFR